MLNKIPSNLFKILDNYIDLESIRAISIKEKNITEDIFHEWCDRYKLFINLERTNNMIRINKFHNKVNELIDYGDYYLSCTETLEQRANIYSYKNIIIPYSIFKFVQFIWYRAFPKLPFLKKVYFLISKGENRVVSKAETLGRLISCGFSIENYFEYDGLTYVISKKVSPPTFDRNASYSPIFKMKRVGKNSNYIYVYKFRTMYPYSEYLQDFIVKDNGYANNGKIKDDYRITNWGKFFRKYWLDELPQLLNWIKGEMKLVGVRPLSESFLNEYPNDLKERRSKHKPGCIPPYVALKMQSLDEYIKSDLIYLEQKEKSPFITDIRFFFKAIYNIIFKKIVSG